MLLTLKSFCQQIGPSKTTGFNSLTTPQYKLHCFETLSGYRLVINTDPGVPDLKEALRSIYSDLFVKQVLMNPLYNLGDEVPRNSLFAQGLRNYITARPFFATIST